VAFRDVLTQFDHARLSACCPRAVRGIQPANHAIGLLHEEPLESCECDDLIRRGAGDVLFVNIPGYRLINDQELEEDGGWRQIFEHHLHRYPPPGPSRLSNDCQTHHPNIHLRCEILNLAKAVAIRNFSAIMHFSGFALTNSPTNTCNVSKLRRAHTFAFRAAAGRRRDSMSSDDFWGHMTPVCAMRDR